MRRLVLLALLVPLVAGCGWLGALAVGQSAEQGSSVHVQLTTMAVPSGRVNPVPRWIKLEHLPQKAIPGARLFASAGCTACHTYAGTGSSNLGAPSLTSIGRKHLGIRFQIAHLKCPSCVVKESPMPPFSSLGKRRLHELAVFLEASRGTH
jgi:mono/diheme cytochrome c family protein